MTACLCWKYVASGATGKGLSLTTQATNNARFAGGLDLIAPNLGNAF